MLCILIISLITSILSALHGSGRIAKIYPTILMGVICSLILYITGMEWLSLLGIVIGFLWRIVTRSGKQAHAELVAMDTVNYPEIPDKIRVYEVWKAHYYNPFGYLLGVIISKQINYNVLPYIIGDSQGKRFWDTRRYVELVSGALPQAAVVMALLLIVTIIFV